MLETVLDYIRSPKFRDAIVIQGTAGSGKSSFTLRLGAVLREKGFRPIRIRLRDVNVTKEFFTALGEAVALEDEIYLRQNSRWPAVRNILLSGAVFQDEIPYTYGTEHMRICPYVLILDGWDELSVAVSEGFKQRVKELLVNVRRELLKPYGRTVRVILTGRPSDAVDDCADFFLPDTPVLTLRLLKPEQLVHFAGRMREALAERPIRTDETPVWAMPSDSELQPILEAYEQDFASHTQPHRPDSSEHSDATSVIGTPFLAQLAFRLLADWKGIRANWYEIVRNSCVLWSTSLRTAPIDRRIAFRAHTSCLAFLVRNYAACCTVLLLRSPLTVKRAYQRPNWRKDSTSKIWNREYARSQKKT